MAVSDRRVQSAKPSVGSRARDDGQRCHSDVGAVGGEAWGARIHPQRQRPDFLALAVQKWISERGFKTLYIAPGSPWENPYSETFNRRFRDEFLNGESFVSVLEAKVLGKDYRQDYKCRRPLSALGYHPPSSSLSAALRVE